MKVGVCVAACPPHKPQLLHLFFCAPTFVGCTVIFAYLDRYMVTAIIEHPARLAGSILPKKEVWNNATTAEEKNIKGPSESPSGA